jgi:hypothetical protein
LHIVVYHAPLSVRTGKASLARFDVKIACGKQRRFRASSFRPVKYLPDSPRGIAAFAGGYR